MYNDICIQLLTLDAVYTCSYRYAQIAYVCINIHMKNDQLSSQWTFLDFFCQVHIDPTARRQAEHQMGSEVLKMG